MLKVGTNAPKFTLKDQNENDINMSDFKGQWVVLYFYPKALTPGCTVQACSLTDSKKNFDKFNAKILGISADKPSKLKDFESKKNLTLPYLVMKKKIL